MDTIIQALETIFKALCDMYYAAYGDSSESQSGDLNIAIGNVIWLPLLTMGYPCILYLRNTSVDAALLQEIQFSWNKELAIGGRIAYDKGIVFDKVVGTLYIKVGDATKTGAVNFCTVSLKHSDQNI